MMKKIIKKVKKLINNYRQRRLRKMVKITVKVLKSLDSAMAKAGYSRQRRRQTWRDLIKSRGGIVEYVEKILQ